MELAHRLDNEANFWNSEDFDMDFRRFIIIIIIINSIIIINIFDKEIICANSSHGELSKSGRFVIVGVRESLILKTWEFAKGGRS